MHARGWQHWMARSGDGRADYAALASQARSIISTWPDEWQVEFNERAATAEDNGVPREVAEFESFWSLRRQF